MMNTAELPAVDEPTRLKETKATDQSARKSVWNVVLAAASLLFALIIAESLLRFMHPLQDPYWRQKIRPDQVSTYIPSQFPPNMKLQMQTEAGLSGMMKQVTFSVNNMGYRGEAIQNPKPDGEFRIFVVGGSSTENLYLDDRVTFTRVIQDSLRQMRRSSQHIKVYGAGKSGDRTYDHVAMVGHRIAHLQPDLIIVFAGINDLLAATHGRDYLFLPKPSEKNTWRANQLLRFAMTEFQVGRLLFAVLKPNDYRVTTEEIRMISDFKGAAARRQALPVAAGATPTNLKPFRENLQSVIALGRAHNASMMFITQATTWNSKVDARAEQWHWMNIGRDVAYSQAQMDAAMESYNNQVRALGRELGVPVFDLAAALPKSLEYFYDDVHFNVKGAAVAGGMVARFLAASNLLTPPTEVD